MKPLVLVFALALPALSQTSADSSKIALGVPQDWSHRHVVFSAAPSNETRSLQQWMRRNAAAPQTSDKTPPGQKKKQPPPNLMHRDWAASLGPGTSVAAGQYPAKYSFGVTTANCASAPAPDYVVFPTGVVGSSSQASIVAFDNLYSGCGGTVPSTYWAYNTGGSVVTSPVFSLDGSQVMFVQSSGGIASLVLLKWAASSTATSTSPNSIATVAASSYSACTAPCMTSIALSGSADDSNSSPYYDYSGDKLYVGDNSGTLHLFHPVLLGTPTEVIGGGWPDNLTGHALSSPVFDSATGRVFVGSSFDGPSGGQLIAVSASTGNPVAFSNTIARGNGITTSPVLDGSAGKVYVFAGNDGSAACPGSVACSAVYQFATGFVGPTAWIKAVVGTNATTLYSGDFDNAWYASANSTGSLWVCGKDFSGFPNMYRLTVTAGTMSTTATSGPHMGGGVTDCSSVTDVYNAGQGSDRIFSSVNNNGNASGCGNAGCIQSLIVTNWQKSTAYTLGQTVLDASMNIEIVATPGTSNAVGTPSWSSSWGGTTADGSVKWVNQGFLTPTTAQAWQASTTYSSQFRITDSNGNNEICLFSCGTSGSGSHPTWNTTIGLTTPDGGITWINAGPMVNFGLPASGGTSSIILDNTVGSGTLSGASQVYYTPLSTGNCGAGNGCAVQASQSGLN